MRGKVFLDKVLAAQYLGKVREWLLIAGQNADRISLNQRSADGAAALERIERVDIPARMNVAELVNLKAQLESWSRRLDTFIQNNPGLVVGNVVLQEDVVLDSPVVRTAATP